MDRGACWATVHGGHIIFGHNLETKQQWRQNAWHRTLSGHSFGNVYRELVSVRPNKSQGQADSEISSIELLSCVWLFVTPWTACSTLGLPVHHQLLELAQTHVHQVTAAIRPSHPLSSPSPAFNLSQYHGIFRWVSYSHQAAKYWSFSFSISPSNEYSGLISFRMDWLDLLAVQGTLKGLLQHNNSESSLLQCSVFFMVQLSHPYVTTGKTIGLTRWTLVSKAMSLLFNMWSRYVRPHLDLAFLPKSKHILISWLQSPSAMIWSPRKKISLINSPS